MLNYIPEGHLIRVRVAVTHVPATVAITALTMQSGQLIPHRVSIQCATGGFGYTEHFLDIGGQDLLQLSVQPVDFLPSGALALVALDLVSTTNANTLVKLHICSGFITGLNGLTYPEVANNMNIPASNAIIISPMVPVAGTGATYIVPNNLRVKLVSAYANWSTDANAGTRIFISKFFSPVPALIGFGGQSAGMIQNTIIDVFCSITSSIMSFSSIVLNYNLPDLWLLPGGQILNTCIGIKAGDTIISGKFVLEAIPWL